VPINGAGTGHPEGQLNTDVLLHVDASGKSSGLIVTLACFTTESLPQACAAPPCGGQPGSTVRVAAIASMAKGPS